MNIAIDPQEMAANSAAASRLLRIMSNEKRLMILCNLVGGEKSVQQLQAATGLAQSAVSQQLAILRAEGIVRNRREAQSVFYSLASGAAAELLTTLHRIFCGGSVRP